MSWFERLDRIGAAIYTVLQFDLIRWVLADNFLVDGIQITCWQLHRVTWPLLWLSSNNSCDQLHCDGCLLREEKRNPKGRREAANLKVGSSSQTWDDEGRSQRIQSHQGIWFFKFSGSPCLFLRPFERLHFLFSAWQVHLKEEKQPVSKKRGPQNPPDVFLHSPPYRGRYVRDGPDRIWKGSLGAIILCIQYHMIFSGFCFWFEQVSVRFRAAALLPNFWRRPVSFSGSFQRRLPGASIVSLSVWATNAF